MKVNSGNDLQSRQMGGGGAGAKGTATATAATTMTDSGASWTVNGWTGNTVVAGSAFGIVASNTATVLTIDRWYDAASPGGTAATTPAGTATYCILPGAMAAWFMALTANATAAAATDTTLTAEITTAGGGLIRKLATYAHTAAAASFTLTGAFTANGSDTLPVTIAKVGTFHSLSAGLMQFETVLGATATLTLSGDNVTVTETVSL